MTARPDVAPLRAVIVDDEPLARELLVTMLADLGVEVLGEAGDGAEAVRVVRALAPDVLFLDVQMPEQDGFGVLGQLRAEVGAEGLPAVVFVTAYDEYALRAFDVHALDYVLKPFDEERLERAVGRARGRAARPADDAAQRRLVALLEELQAPRRWAERLVIRVGERAFFQPVRDIQWLEASGKYVKVHVGKETHTIRETMLELERMLDPAVFIRLSRSAIVNVDRIREVQPWFHGDYVVIMQNGAQVTSTRGYRGALVKLLGK